MEAATDKLMEQTTKKRKLEGDAKDGLVSSSGNGEMDTVLDPHSAPWDYQKNLDLLKIKLTKSSVKQQEKIRCLVMECMSIGEEPDLENAETENGVSVNSPNMEVELPAIVSAERTRVLSPAVIKQIIYLMTRFKKKVSDDIKKSNLLSNAAGDPLTKEPVSSNEKAVDVEPRWLGVSRRELGEILTEFEQYFNKGFFVSERENPLDNDLVLKNIFSYLKMDSLTTCRVVNRKWNTNAVAFVRENHKSVLINKCSRQLDYDFTNTELFPLSKFKLYLRSNEDFIPFFKKYGSHIKDLHIETFRDLGSMPGDEAIRNLNPLKLILQNVPYLISLSMSEFQASVVDNQFLLNKEELRKIQLPRVKLLTLSENQTQHCLNGLFAVLSNLKILILNHDENEPVDNFSAITASLPNLRLTELRSPSSFVYPLDFLRELRMHSFTVLEIAVILDTLEHTYAFKDLLESQAPSLENFIIPAWSVGPIEEHFRVYLPMMPSLKRLEICDEVDEVLFPLHLFAPGRIPKIRSFSATPRMLEEFLGNGVYAQVDELYIKKKLDSIQNIEVLDRVGAWFPELRKLQNLWTNPARADTVPLIVSNCPNLEDLELCFRYNVQDKALNINCVFAGLSADNTRLLSDIKIQEYPNLLSRIHTSRPSLSDLKGLSKLKLRFLNMDPLTAPSVVIDEIGVNLALLRLPPLLDLTLIGHFTIAEELAGRLVSHHKNVFLMPVPQTLTS